tara:strand:- start:114 stop:773 length:660 start_codon:yes stop_codon:yes gene_type:complete
MATRREKKDLAQSKIPIPPILFARLLPPPLIPYYLAGVAGFLGAKVLIEIDPLNIISGDDAGNFEVSDKNVETVLKTAVLGGALLLEGEEAASEIGELLDSPLGRIVTEETVGVAQKGIKKATSGRRMTTPRPKPLTKRQTSYGSGRFQSQFGQDMGFNFSQLSKPKPKRTKSMKASDKKLSKAFKQANLMCRKKNGQFKKGKSQADVAKCAHRLRKKM